MKKVSKEDFDFSKAAEYRKIGLVPKVDVRVAETEETVISFASGGVETKNQALPGDYILKGSAGGGYVIKSHRFFEIYEEDPVQRDSYRTKITRNGLLLLEDVSFVAAWGEEQVTKAGGVIIEAGPYVFGVDRDSFVREYGRVDDSAEKTVFALVSDDLSHQRAEAEKRGLTNHLLDIDLRLANKALFESKA
jgi:hypothetical protein